MGAEDGSVIRYLSLAGIILTVVLYSECREEGGDMRYKDADTVPSSIDLLDQPGLSSLRHC